MFSTLSNSCNCNNFKLNYPLLCYNEYRKAKKVFL